MLGFTAMTVCQDGGGEETFSELRVCRGVGELSVTCLKGHSLVTPPLNILLNDLPNLLTLADKAKELFIVRGAPPRHPLVFPSLSSPSHPLSLSWLAT